MFITVTRGVNYCALSYLQGFIDSVLNSKGGSHQNKDEKHQGSVYIPYMKDSPEISKLIGNRYDIRPIFKTKQSLRSSLMKTRPEVDPQQTAQCVFSIPSECGGSYIGETDF
jgi:hypothetical protein